MRFKVNDANIHSCNDDDLRAHTRKEMAKVHDMAECPAEDCAEEAAQAQNNISMYDQTAQNTQNTNT